MVYFSARVGNVQTEKNNGRYGENTQNRNGRKLKDFFSATNYKL
jgi:hypothetical protein